MACQEANSSINPPSVGAMIGATPRTRINLLVIVAAAWPEARSRTMAVGMTSEAEPAIAAISRIQVNV